MTKASVRLLSSDLGAHRLPDAAANLLSTSEAVLGETPAASECGLWEAGPGRDEDVEADELFLVLSGAGTVTFDDGSSIELEPGVLVRLHEGDRTVWEISVRLRKLYLA